VAELPDAEPRVPSVAKLGALPAERFVAAVTPLFEGAPRFLRRLAAQRPFRSAAAMFEEAEAIALSLPEEEAVELVDAHPRLGAPPPTVSALSFREQGYDRDARVGGTDTDAERERVAAELNRLNDAYERRFGFRYCVFVAGRSRAELLPDMEAALSRDRHAELRRALVDVARIARDRYRKLRPEEWE